MFLFAFACVCACACDGNVSECASLCICVCPVSVFVCIRLLCHCMRHVLCVCLHANPHTRYVLVWWLERRVSAGPHGLHRERRRRWRAAVRGARSVDARVARGRHTIRGAVVAPSRGSTRARWGRTHAHKCTRARFGAHAHTCTRARGARSGSSSRPTSAASSSRPVARCVRVHPHCVSRAIITGACLLAAPQCRDMLAGHGDFDVILVKPDRHARGACA